MASVATSTGGVKRPRQWLHIARYQPTPPEQAQRKKEALAERVRSCRGEYLGRCPQEAARCSFRGPELEPNEDFCAWLATGATARPSALFEAAVWSLIAYNAVGNDPLIPQTF
jgi:hypothetical protein